MELIVLLIRISGLTIPLVSSGWVGNIVHFSHIGNNPRIHVDSVLFFRRKKIMQNKVDRVLYAGVALFLYHWSFKLHPIRDYPAIYIRSNY
jgi:hypothetical protein